MAVPPRATMMPTGGFRLEVTPLGWRIVGLYVAIWGALFALAHLLPGSWSTVGNETTEFALWDMLLLQPIGAEIGPGFRPWQLLTAPLTYPPAASGSLVLAFLGFAFFAAPVERYMGSRGFVTLFAISLLGAVFGGLLVGAVMGPARAHFGFGAASLAIIIVHCMITPEAVVPFFFVVAVKLRWIAIAVGLLVFIRALAPVSPLGASGAAGGYELGGVAAGYLWFRYGGDLDPRKRARRRKAKRLIKVVQDQALGDSADDGPVYH